MVSVVMPSYNSEKYIAESIQSIIDQTYTNWEFIIVDGHSSDKTIEIINRYIEKDCRIKFVFDEGKGIGAALNQGCKLAKGKYIARMDTDDISLPNRFEEEVRFLENHKDCVLVSAAAIYIDENSKEIGYSFPYTWPSLVRNNPTGINHPCVMMRKDKYLLTGGYPPIKRAEDLMLWHLLMKYGKIKILEKMLLKYRLSDDSLTCHTTSFFNKNVNNVWKKYSNCDLSDVKILDEINTFIRDNVTNSKVEFKRKNDIEKELLSTFSHFMPPSIAIKLIFFLKNLYGILGHVQ